jgi:hypothetical protein
VVTGSHVGNRAADGGDHPGAFVSRDDREVRDRVLAVAYVEVGAANAASCDADRNLAGGGLAEVELFDRQRCPEAGDDGSCALQRASSRRCPPKALLPLEGIRHPGTAGFLAETFEGIHAADRFWAGGPAGPREWGARHHDRDGISYRALETRFGDMTRDEALPSAELLATDVMPHRRPPGSGLPGRHWDVTRQALLLDVEEALVDEFVDAERA